MKNKLEVVYKHCCSCGSNSEDLWSQCCNAEASDGRCIECGKFCKTYPCPDCDGYGPFEIKKGDEVGIFFYQNSPEYLKKQFKNNIKKSKTYRGKVLEILDKDTVKVKLSTKIIKVELADIDIE